MNRPANLFAIALCFLLVGGSQGWAQTFWDRDSLPNPQRLRLVHGASLGTYTGAMTLLGLAWYANEDLGGFHFFDDRQQWQQMDKVGHSYGGYLGGTLLYGWYRWAGMPRQKAALWSGTVSFLMMSSIEGLDGLAEKWGFSWSDVGANFAGSGLATLNHLAWDEPRLQLKWNYLPSPYAGDPDFEDLFGRSFPEWMLKDYNGQSYWLSVRVHSFLPAGNFRDHYPRWLNLAVGYSAFGLEGGYDDPLSDWREREYRQWYLSLDLDLSHIRARRPWVRALLSTVNYVRIPLPALRFDRYGMGFEPLR